MPLIKIHKKMIQEHWIDNRNQQLRLQQRESIIIIELVILKKLLSCAITEIIVTVIENMTVNHEWIENVIEIKNGKKIMSTTKKGKGTKKERLTKKRTKIKRRI